MCQESPVDNKKVTGTFGTRSLSMAARTVRTSRMAIIIFRIICNDKSIIFLLNNVMNDRHVKNPVNIINDT